MFKRWVMTLFLAVLWVASACSAKKTTVPPVTNQQPSASGQSSDLTALDGDLQNQEILEARERAVSSVIDEALQIYEQGKVSWFSGNREAARAFFRKSLDKLSSSEFEFADDTRVEETYRNLLSEMQRLKIVASLSLKEPAFPILDSLEPTESPLDEIGAVDLYKVEVGPGLEDRVSEDLRNTKFDIPIVVTKEVLKFLDYYQGRGRRHMEASLIRSGKYLPLFRKIFEKEGVPLDLVYMAHVESLFKPQAYSRARALGIWQFMKGTALLYGLKTGWWLDERLDFHKSTVSAALYLKDLYEEFGSWDLALAAYNGGPGRISRVIRRYGEMDYWTMAKRRLLVRETRNYVPSILAAIIISRNPEHYGFKVEPAPPLEFETVALDYQVDLAVIAESLDVPLARIAELNPELQRGVTPFEAAGYRLKVPPGSGDLLTQQLAKIPPEKRLRLTHHSVRQGETLSHISARYGVSIAAIAEMNHIRNINRLRLGQDLIIPLSSSRVARAEGMRQNPPKSGRYTVQQGDSLYRIARLYGIALKDLFRWNDIQPGELIHPGQEIRLSAGTSSAPRANTSGGENK